MIKSLLDADENPPEGIKVTTEETVVEPQSIEQDAGEFTAVSAARTATQTEDILEIPALADDSPKFAETSGTTAADELNSSPVKETIVEPPKFENEIPTLFQTNFEPESTAETMRKSGLAYAAAITLFAAVVFMMIVGWGADLLLGTKPWGIVGGIVLGAIIGFVQFFRLTSQILKNKD